MSWKKVLLIPAVVRLGRRAPRDINSRWNEYWRSVRATGTGGEVLWDSGSDREVQLYVARMRQHLDTTLPIVDVGCGNGRFTQSLAGCFPYALGVDLSPNAIARAEEEYGGVDNLSFRALDMTASETGRRLHAELGEANVFVRGVFHVLSRSARLSMAGNLRDLLGSRGRLFLAETDFKGGALDYLEYLGATPSRMPTPLARVLASGLPRPRHFGAAQLRECFPASAWVTVASGPTTIDAVAMREAMQPEPIPGFFAILGVRASG